MCKKRRDGVITPLAAISLLLVLSLILTLLEGARFNYTKEICDQQVVYAAHCFLGQYDTELYEQYGIFGTDIRLFEEKEKIFENMAGFLSPNLGISFLNPENYAIKDFKYRLLTDEGGADFRKQAVTSYLYSLPGDILEQLKSRYTYALEVGTDEDEKKIIEDAEKALKEAEKINKNNKDKEADISTLNLQNSMEKHKASVNVAKKKSEKEDLIGDYKEKRNSFALSQVLPQGFTVSSATRTIEQRIEERMLNVGTMEVEASEGLDEKLLFPMYLTTNYTHALSSSVEHSKEDELKYQLEYIVVGKSSDRANLEGVVKRLVIFRQMVWFAYRLSDSVSRQQAEAIASVIMGGLGLPMLIEPVALLILLAWSYDDAVGDVRELMKGNKVAMLPSKAKVDNSKEMNASYSLGYQEYLFLLIALEKQQKVTYRALDVIEEKLSVGDRTFSADCVITAIKGSMTYQYDAVFGGQIGHLKTEAFIYSHSSCFEERY